MPVEESVVHRLVACVLDEARTEQRPEFVTASDVDVIDAGGDVEHLADRHVDTVTPKIRDQLLDARPHRLGARNGDG